MFDFVLFFFVCILIIILMLVTNILIDIIDEKERTPEVEAEMDRVVKMFEGINIE